MQICKLVALCYVYCCSVFVMLNNKYIIVTALGSIVNVKINMLDKSPG